MGRKKDYGEIIAEHIAAVVKDRHIKNVQHFTRLKNLPGILEHGLRSRTWCANADYDIFVSDIDRRDEEDEAVSVSIPCYHWRMFEAKRHRPGDEPWAILILHPSILWNYHCLFYR